MISDDASQKNESLQDIAVDGEPEELVDQDQPVSSNKKNHSRSDIALLGGEVEILIKKRLKYLDRGPALAYAARSKGDTNELFFALVCDRHLVPRIGMSEKFSTLMSPGLVRLLASGVVFWPPTKDERFVFIYQNTLGKPLMKDLNQSGLGWKQERVMRSLITPMIHTLLDLRDSDMVHGNINPMNIYEGRSDDSGERFILGDCLAAPPGYLQPKVFETIERAQCDALAKGRGTLEDDIYAFGVTLTMALRNKDPLAGMSDEEITHAKIEYGSYVALTGKERFTGAVLELLRGLLFDDSYQRWTLDEIEAWLDGQRLSPKQSTKKGKSSRPLHFNGSRYFRPEALAMDLDQSPNEAVQMIDGGMLEQWVSRSLEDNLIKGRLEKAVAQAQSSGRGPGYADKLLSRVSIALDTGSPIHFKGLHLHPEGIPYAMAEAFLRQKDLSPFVEIINQQLVAFWVSLQQTSKVDVSGLIGRHDNCKKFLKQHSIGYGVERCLYYLCPEAHCVSEKLDGYFVRNPEELMYAFEKISENTNRPELFIDRHVSAFLSIKDRRMIDPYLVELGAKEHYKRVLANVKVLATIQKRSRMEKFPGITHWIADIAEPVYQRFHDRDLREKLRRKVEKLKSIGDLSRMIILLDDNDMKQSDFINFKKAMDEYLDLLDENAELTAHMDKPETFGREIGQEIAAIVSGVLAGIMILGFAFMHFIDAGIF